MFRLKGIGSLGFEKKYHFLNILAEASGMVLATGSLVCVNFY